jgi:CelD/BcsL family acetyltransferase involved in cellulose biosynthesis
VAPEWRALQEGALSSEFFQSWEWTSAWLEAFQHARPMKCLLVRDSSRLVGVLPLLSQPLETLRGRSGLGTAANDETPVTGVSCSGQPGPVVRVLLEHLVAARRGLRLVLPRVSIDAPFYAALSSQAPALRLGIVAREARRSQVVNIQGTWEEYLETRSKHTRREWRRKRKRLEEAGRTEVVLVTRLEDVERVLPQIQEIERRSWKEAQGTSFSADQDCQRFYSELARRCAARGWLRLHLLYVDGKPAAHVFGVAYANELLALKTSFDGSLASLSPGVTLMLALLEGAFREGRSAVDFLGVASRWKAEMANAERAYVDVLLFGRGLIDCESYAFVEQHLKPFARARLPRLVALKRKIVDRVAGRQRALVGDRA